MATNKKINELNALATPDGDDVFPIYDITATETKKITFTNLRLAIATFIGSLTFETPTGTVDGSNTTFSVTATPQFVIVDGISYFENNGYTIVGLTITTSVPPSGFIKAAI